jgi:hypothetical protein
MMVGDGLIINALSGRHFGLGIAHGNCSFGCSPEANVLA